MKDRKNKDKELRNSKKDRAQYFVNNKLKDNGTQQKDKDRKLGGLEKTAHLRFKNLKKMETIP